MTSALAQQLRGIASIDADRITSHHGAPVGKSYLFTPREAAALDNNEIYSFASTGFDELLDVDLGMEEFEEELFSERSKGTDRMMLTEKENKELGLVLDRCLRRLGKWLQLKSAGKCLEWLIRRFRVHELNVNTLIRIFLPYHAAPQFPRILAILSIPDDSPYRYLLKPNQAKPITIPRELLLMYLTPRKDPSLHMLRDVLSLLPEAIVEKADHRALHTFWASTILDVVRTESNNPKGLNDSVGRVLVEGLVRALCCESASVEAIASVYPPTMFLLRYGGLSLPAFLPILAAIPVNKHVPIETRLLMLMAALENVPQGFDGELGQAWEGFWVPKKAVVGEQRRKETEEHLVTLRSKGMRSSFDILARWFANRPQHFENVISTMMTAPDLPQSLINDVVSTLKFQLSTSTDEPTTAACQSLLAALYQRFPGTEATPTATAPTKKGGKKRKAGADGDVSMVSEADLERYEASSPALLAISAEAAGRVYGCKRLLECEIAEEDKEEVRGIMLERLRDDEPEVLETLYANSDSLLELISAEDALNALEPVFYDYATPRDSLILNVKFVLSLKTSVEAILRKAIFPLLVSTKARKLTVSAVWEAIRSSQVAKDGLLQGLSQALDGSSGVEPAVQNGKIAEVLARNLALSTGSSEVCDFLVAQVASPNALNQVRLLALLVLEKLFPLLEATRALSMGVAVLDALRFDEFAAFDTKEEASAVFGEDILERIYSKSTHEKTMILAKSTVLARLSSVEAPSGKIEWLAATTNVGYVTFIAKLYSLANSTLIPPSVGAAILRGIFAQLKDDSCLFLARTWTDSRAAQSSRVAALRHGQAFISAHLGTSGLTKDFQLVVPSLLVCLSDADEHVRRAGLGLVKLLADGAPDSQLSPFALDDIYGATSEEAKLLEYGYIKRYLVAVAEASAEVAVDAGALRQFHSRLLNAAHGEGKKQANFRREVIFVLGSHIKAWRSIPARTSLLQTLELVSGTKKLDIIQDLVLELQTSWSELPNWWNVALPASIQAYVASILSGVDEGVVRLVSKGDSKLFEALLAMVGTQPAAALPALAPVSILKQLQIAVYSDLPIDWQLKLINSVLDGLQDLPQNISSEMKAVLKQMSLNAYGLVQIFNGFAESLSSRHEPRQKRTRTDSSDATDRSLASLSSLMAFLESRDLTRMPESASLMASCLNLLSETMQHQEEIESSLIDYVQQTLLLLLTNVARKIKDAQSVLCEALSVETVVRLIRSSTNPRTSQQALLFVGSLANLTPDAVLHNVMPIFTYIGSSDFQKDDVHSFSVVERTVESIVPIMVKSAKAKAETELDLLRDLRPLLQIFADMAGRLPSHRSSPFFSHLVETLGAKDFLAAMVMLICDRSAERIVKSKSGSSSSALQLPLALIRSQGRGLEVEAVNQILGEVHRLLDAAVDSSAEDPLLAPVQTLGEEVRQKHLRLRALALVLVCKPALPSKLSATEGQIGTNIAQQLIDLSTVAALEGEGVYSSATKACAGLVLDQVLALLPVANFLDLSLDVLDGSSTKAIEKVLNILVERLPMVQPTTRESMTEKFSALIKLAVKLVADPSRAHSDAALQVYALLTKSQVATEDGVLAQGVPVLLELAKREDEDALTSKVLSCMTSLPKRLQTRMIPHIKPILDMCLHDCKNGSSSRIEASLELAGQQISATPGFIPAASLKAILETTLELSEAVSAEAIRSFLGTVAKRVSTQNLLPMIFEIWTNVKSAGRVVALKRFFLLVQRAIRNAARSSFQPLVKQLFTFFLDAFDLRSSSKIAPVEVADVEDMAVAAFLDLVEKLNEAAFKPLFSRVYDWAFVNPDEPAVATSRKTVVYVLLNGLIDKFKTIMTPYLSVVFDATASCLNEYAQEKESDVELWKAIIEMLRTSFETDDGVFWSTENLDKVIGSLAKQFSVVLHLTSSGRAADNQLLAQLCSCLTSLALSTGSEVALKTLNTAILMTTRAEDAQVRIAALTALHAIWMKQEELVQFVPETVAQFLSELLEDENADVEAAAKKVLARIEALVGDLSSYLE